MLKLNMLLLKKNWRQVKSLPSVWWGREERSQNRECKEETVCAIIKHMQDPMPCHVQRGAPAIILRNHRSGTLNKLQKFTTNTQADKVPQVIFLQN